MTWMRALRDSDLAPTTKLVGVMVALRSDKRGQSWPTYQLIAADCGTDRRHVIRRVKELRDAGWLIVAARSNGHGSQSNAYLLITPTGGDTSATPLVTPQPPGGDTSATLQGVTPQPPRSDRPKEVREDMHTQPVDNPVLKAVINSLATSTRIR